MRIERSPVHESLPIQVHLHVASHKDSAANAVQPISNGAITADHIRSRFTICAIRADLVRCHEISHATPSSCRQDQRHTAFQLRSSQRRTPLLEGEQEPNKKPSACRTARVPIHGTPGEEGPNNAVGGDQPVLSNYISGLVSPFLVVDNTARSHPDAPGQYGISEPPAG